MHLPRRRTLAALTVLSVLPLVPSLVMRLGTWGDRYGDPGSTPARAVALVLGAGLRADGTPTPFLQQRLDLGAALYRRGTVRAVLVTGDHRRDSHNEPGGMKAYLMAQGIPESAVVEDHAGFSTYDSCFRARAVFGVTEAVVVTQGYHLPRAVFTCRRLGVDAVGLGGSELAAYPGETVQYSAREVLSTVKATWQLLTRPDPHFLGPHETGLDGAIRQGRP